MREPFDLDAVDGLLANAISKAANFPINECAVWTALDVLEGPLRQEIPATSITGGDHFVAGFELAKELCCEILRDPLHIDLERVGSIIDDQTMDLRDSVRESIADLRAGRRKKSTRRSKGKTKKAA